MIGRTKRELFLAACRRNALRREAQLPLIDVKEEMAKEHKSDLFDAWFAACEKHADKKKEFYDKVHAEILARTGEDYNDSLSGKRVIAHKSNPVFEAYLEGLGYKNPTAKKK